MAVVTIPNASTNQYQYLRQIELIVSGPSLGNFVQTNPFNGFDLSNLRIKFNVKRSDTQTPNVADIRVYNVEPQTALAIYKALSPNVQGVIQSSQGYVLLSAGYQSNFGTIFAGNIKQIILGRESATDTFIDIIAGDGHRAYNFGVVNKTIAGGSTQSDQVFASIQAMASVDGTTAGPMGNLSNNGTKLPRGKVMFGNAKNYLRNVAQNTQQSWSIQNGAVTFVPIQNYLPNQAVVLTSKTGLIGTPQQTNIGVNMKCLLNPLIKISTVVNIDQASVDNYKIDLSTPNSPANIAPALNLDGNYYVMVAEHSGDTRGVDWYTSLVTINTDVTAVLPNQLPVLVGYGP
jgi:hypothetical protein